MAGVKVGANAQYTYSYDQNGNIIRENKGGYTKYSYSYDEKGQLTGFSDADVYYDDAPSEYWYEYDDAGNLTDVYFGNSQDEERVAQYQYTDSSWGDLLTSFNGQAITYDAIGNPLNYYDGNIFTWKNGRQLVSWEHGSGVTYGSLEYDTEGYRASKTTENGETSYLYSGGSLLRETKTNPTTNATVYDLYFTYDEAGRPFSISSYDETLYYFYDIYGNVKYLYDAYGNLVAEYTYHDPWGNDVELTCHYFEGYWIAELNPFTYKGYYYDADLQMYYCGSRYYDPETCRWINADGYVSTGQGIVGNNMYAYCNNSPVVHSDRSGMKMVRDTPDETFSELLDGVDSIYYEYIFGATVTFSEHHKRGTTNPANRNKHQKGQARKGRDQGGEKGDARRHGNPNKRHPHNFETESIDTEVLLPTALILGASATIVYLVANDATGVGVLDDSLIPPLVTIIWENASILVG